jgi:hypothetical protein
VVSQSRHRQATVSTGAIASMLITSVAGRQIVTVTVPGPLPERRVTSVRRVARRAAVRGCGVGSKPTMDSAGLITVVAQCRTHTAQVHGAITDERFGASAPPLT